MVTEMKIDIDINQKFWAKEESVSNSCSPIQIFLIESIQKVQLKLHSISILPLSALFYPTDVRGGYRLMLHYLEA